MVKINLEEWFEARHKADFISFLEDFDKTNKILKARKLNDRQIGIVYNAFYSYELAKFTAFLVILTYVVASTAIWQSLYLLVNNPEPLLTGLLITASLIGVIFGVLVSLFLMEKYYSWKEDKS